MAVVIFVCYYFLMKDHKRLSKEFFDNQASIYDEVEAAGGNARSLYPHIIRLMDEHGFDSALDVGCGTGELIDIILKQEPGKRFTGIDISDEMIRIADEKLDGAASFIVGDSEDLPFDDCSFDVVICNHSFHHYPAPEKVLVEIRRVLKGGGLFIMGENYLPDSELKAMNRKLRFSKSGDFRMYSGSELLWMMNKVFSCVHYELAGTKSCIVWGIR